MDGGLQSLREDKGGAAIWHNCKIFRKPVTKPMEQWWRNRDVILVSAVIIGLVLGRGASWPQPLVLPALAVLMTLTTMGVRTEMLRSLRELWRPALAGLFLNYLMLGGVLLGLSILMDRLFSSRSFNQCQVNRRTLKISHSP